MLNLCLLARGVKTAAGVGRGGEGRGILNVKTNLRTMIGDWQVTNTSLQNKS